MGEDKRLGHVDYHSMTMLELAINYFDWRFYGKKDGIDIDDKDAVVAWLTKKGFTDEKTLAEVQREERQKLYDKMDTERLAKEYERRYG